MDTFGPISDNAQGIAEMSGDVKGEGAKILTSLDAVGNTTKAITKGIAIATAVLAATALFGAFTDAIKNSVLEAGKVIGDQALQFQGVLDVADPRNLVGLIIGASVVFLFSGLAINAVSRAAGAVVMEVRNQFQLHPGIMKGTEKLYSRFTPRTCNTRTTCSYGPNRCWLWPWRRPTWSLFGGLNRHRNFDGGIPR